MAGKIPAGSIETKIKLDGEQPKQTLTSLRRSVTQMTQAWKAEQTELKATGKSVEAAEAKYKGLGKAIDSQEKLIKQIKEEQAKLDTTTANGAEAYNKLGKQLVSATTKYNSLKAQQDKAKNSMDYYKSGLADLDKEYKSSTEVSRNYVARLQAENKQYQASSEKMAAYKSSLANLTKQLKIQEDELKKVAAESGKDSSAYKTQENRVNKTAKSLADLKNEQKDVRLEFDKFHPTGIDKLDKSIDKARASTSKLGSTFKGVTEKMKSMTVAAAAGVAGAGAFEIGRAHV